MLCSQGLEDPVEHRTRGLGARGEDSLYAPARTLPHQAFVKNDALKTSLIIPPGQVSRGRKAAQQLSGSPCWTSYSITCVEAAEKEV